MYDAFSNDYDRFVNWDSRLAYEMPFIVQSINLGNHNESNPSRILDAACGTGMHIIDLAKRGYPSAGADISHGMIERAKINSNVAGVQVELKVAGFGNLRTEFEKSTLFPFDAILCLGNSLPHITDSDGLLTTFIDFRACLRPGGVLLIQNRNFDAVMQNQQRWMEPQSFQEGNNEWLFLRFYDYLPGNLIDFNIINLFRSGSENWQQQVHTTRLRPILQADLIQALYNTGFGNIRSYGSMNGEPYDPSSSGNLIVLAQAIE